MSRLVPALVVWIAFAVGFCPSPWDDRQIWFGGDQALLLQAADSVLAGDPPLVGAYSKDSLYHPGPLFSYLMALVQWITRGNLGLTNTAVSVIQAATVPILVLFAQRVSGSWFVALTVPLLIVFNFPFLFYVRIIWNVAIVLPALSLALWLTWEITPKSTWLLPLLTLVLCFLGQVHMAYTPLAVTLGVVAIARFLSRGVAGRWTTIALTTVVALACWSPVLWDAVRNEGGGNLGALLQHFRQERQGQGHDLWTSWGAMHGVGLHATPRAFPFLTAFALSAALMVSTFWRRDENAMPLRWLAVVLGCSWLVVLLSISRIPDAIDSYYLRPLAVLLVVHLIGGIAALLLWLRPRTSVRVVEAAIAVGVIVIVAPLAQEEWTRFQTPSWNGYPLREIRMVARSIGSDLRDTGARAACGPTPDSNGRAIGRVRLELQPPDLSGSAASLVYVLQQEGIALSRDPQALAYRILAPADHPPVPGSGRELVRTAKFRVERATTAEHETGGANCPPAPASSARQLQ
jgi:hypothetical protein